MYTFRNISVVPTGTFVSKRAPCKIRKTRICSVVQVQDTKYLCIKIRSEVPMGTPESD